LINPSLSRLWIVAHRGGRELRPENTLAAFKHSIRLGIDMIETDVRWSKDQHLVLIHDRTLERTTNGFGPVNEFTLKDLQQLDAGSHFDQKFHRERIPTLEELFQIAKNKIKILLDAKGDEAYLHQIVEMVVSYRMEFDVVIGVRSRDALSIIQRANPAIRSLSFGTPVETAIDIYNAGADILRLWGHWSPEELVNQITPNHKQIWVMAGEPIEEKNGKITIDELIKYQEAGLHGVILDDPTLWLGREGHSTSLRSSH
jgi:glycerophosphoryl diester phosphodiesterase